MRHTKHYSYTVRCRFFPTFSQPKDTLNSIYIYFQTRKATLTLGKTWTHLNAANRPSPTSSRPPHPPCTPLRHYLHRFDAGNACLVTTSADVFKDTLFPAQDRGLLHRAPSAGCVVGPCRRGGVNFEYQSGVVGRGW